jgi:hypothetical protein
MRGVGIRTFGCKSVTCWQEFALAVTLRDDYLVRGPPGAEEGITLVEIY